MAPRPQTATGGTGALHPAPVSITGGSLDYQATRPDPISGSGRSMKRPRLQALPRQTSEGPVATMMWAMRGVAMDERESAAVEQRPDAGTGRRMPTSSASGPPPSSRWRWARCRSCGSSGTCGPATSTCSARRGVAASTTSKPRPSCTATSGSPRARSASRRSCTMGGSTRTSESSVAASDPVPDRRLPGSKASSRAPSILLAWMVICFFSTLLIWRVRVLLRGPAPLGRAEATSLGVLLATITGGSVVVFLGATPWVYHEDLMWSIALDTGKPLRADRRPGAADTAPGRRLGGARPVDQSQPTHHGVGLCARRRAGGGVVRLRPEHRRATAVGPPVLAAGLVPLGVQLCDQRGQVRCTRRAAHGRPGVDVDQSAPASVPGRERRQVLQPEVLAVHALGVPRTGRSCDFVPSSRSSRFPPLRPRPWAT